jgi:cyclopropane-fatty-acyl-phospholipid synthase
LIGPSEIALRAVLDRYITRGVLEMRTHDGRFLRFEGDEDGPEAVVDVNSSRTYRRLAMGGPTGLIEGYMAGDWDSPDLERFLEFAAYNIEPLGGRQVVPEPLQPVQRVIHAMRANTPKGSKKNIEYHYDLGNDFYKLWLDDTMTYSCAVFENDVEDLCDAQVRKWDRLLDLLDLRRGQHLLEIGCGWGGFAMHAAREAGCRVTGISLSQEQTAWARERVADEGLDDLVDIRIQDYREVDERYDAVASIEMFEAVGERFWPAFFQTMRRALKPGHRAAMQVITVADVRFDRYRKNTDFIQKYIFPGGMLPSPTAFREAAEREGLRVGQPDFFGKSYAATLGEWRRRFDEVLPRVRELGFDEHFERMWRYYLASCRAGFLAGTIDVMRVTLDEPR